MKHLLALSIAMTFLVSCDTTLDDVEQVDLNASSLSLVVGETFTLTATVTPATVNNKTIIWSSANPNIATVSSGIVVGVAKGTTVVSVIAQDNGFTATCIVVVSLPSATSITLDQHSIRMAVNNQEQLNVTIEPQTAATTSLYWSSTDLTVASVNNNGLVTAKGPGTADIIVTSGDDSISDTCTVTVKSIVGRWTFYVKWVEMTSYTTYTYVISDGNSFTSGTTSGLWTPDESEITLRHSNMITVYTGIWDESDSIAEGTVIGVNNYGVWYAVRQ